MAPSSIVKRLLAAGCFTCIQCTHAEPQLVTLPLRNFGLGRGPEEVVLSQDASRFFSLGRGGLFLWDVSSGTVLREYSGPVDANSSPWSLVVSEDGERVLASDGKSVHLWDVSSGTLLVTLTLSGSALGKATLSPNGGQIATVAAGVIRFWDASTGSLVRTIYDRDAGNWIAYSPDGTMVLTGSITFMGETGARIAKLWDAESGLQIRSFSGHTDDVMCVAFSPDATMVATGSGNYLSFTPTTGDYTVRLWDFLTGAEIRTFSGFGRDVRTVAFSADGTRILSASMDWSCRVWDIETGQVLWRVAGDSAAFSADSTRVLTASYRESTVTLHDGQDGTQLRVFTGHTGAVSDLAYTPEGRTFVTASADNRLRVWDTHSGTLRRTIYSSYSTCVDLSADGSLLLTNSFAYGVYRIFDISTGEELKASQAHLSYLRAVAFSPDSSKVLTGADDKTAKLFTLTNPSRLLRTFEGHTAPVYTVAFSREGGEILTGSGDKNAKLWNASTGALIRTFTGHAGSVSAAVFSPDGTALLTGSADKTARLWNSQTGALIRTFSGHAEAVTAVEFSPDGAYVLTGSQDDTARLWDVATGQPIRTFFANKGAVSAAAFSPDGNFLITGGDSGQTFLWYAGDPATMQHERWTIK